MKGKTGLTTAEREEVGAAAEEVRDRRLAITKALGNCDVWRLPNAVMEKATVKRTVALPRFPSVF